MNELYEELLKKPPELVKHDPMTDAIHSARFCEECPHEKVDHPKANKFRCRFCRCEGEKIRKAIYYRRKGKKMP